MPATLNGPVQFGEHIQQVRRRVVPAEDIPVPGQGGIERVKQIIIDRVTQGGGRTTTFADEPAVAFEDGGVTYIFRPNGEFWTILGN